MNSLVENEIEQVEYKIKNLPQFIITPVSILEAEDLSPREVLLLTWVLALANDKDICFASNEHIAKKLNVSKSTVSELISSLVNKNYLEREIIYKEGTKEVLCRALRIKL